MNSEQNEPIDSGHVTEPDGQHEQDGGPGSHTEDESGGSDNDVASGGVSEEPDAREVEGSGKSGGGTAADRNLARPTELHGGVDDDADVAGGG